MGKVAIENSKTTIAVDRVFAARIKKYAKDSGTTVGGAVSTIVMAALKEGFAETLDFPSPRPKGRTPAAPKSQTQRRMARVVDYTGGDSSSGIVEEVSYQPDPEDIANTVALQEAELKKLKVYLGEDDDKEDEEEDDFDTESDDEEDESDDWDDEDTELDEE